MLNKIRLKIIISFLIIGLIFIAVNGYVSITKFENLKNSNIQTEEIEKIDNEITDMKNIDYITIAGFSICSIIVGIIITNISLKPISNLIRSAEQVTKGVKLLGDGKKHKGLDDLVVAFETINKELKENLTEATRQKKQMETILFHMTDGIIACNIEGNVILINSAAKTLLDVKDEATFEEIFKRHSIGINLEKIIYLENISQFEEKIDLGDKNINLFFAPFKDEFDRPAGVIIVIQDITEHVKLDEMRKRFVADVSHELKTPITSIMGYSETMLSNELDPEMNRKFLERISKDAQRMANLVSDLLTLSRFDISKDAVEKEEFDLGELVKKVYESFEFEIEKKNQHCECAITSNVPLVYANKNGIERVVINILSNAIKYTPEGGNVGVYVGFVNIDAYIKIIDTGIGIPKEDIDKIFERFYRVDKARTREMGGTGLGLSIAKEILDQNDAKIDVKSELGKGTEFVIRIPTKQKREKTVQSAEEITNENIKGESNEEN